MKRYILLAGGAGARMVDALICAASAGVYPAGRIDVLLADVDQRGVQGAAMLKAHLADYARVQQAMANQSAAFQTELALHAWPKSLPGGASTLTELTSDTEVDALLCQALFDQEAVKLDLHVGFHGRPTLAQVAFAGLLDAADANPDDPLHALVDNMTEAANAGEDVRVVLAGSICSGTGAAGVPALARFIRERVPESVRIGAVLMAAVTDQQDPDKAKEAIAQYAREGLCEAVCVLGLPQSTRPSAPAELSRLTDWLGVYCMDVLLHRPVWPSGVFTVRAEDGPLSWRIFGKAAERYRLAYGSLFKTALALTVHIGPEVERRLRRPFFLRDMFGWYAHYYRRMETSRKEEMETLGSILRLMRVLLLWLGGICKTLPTDMRYASVLAKLRNEARNHYDGLTELVGHLTILDDDMQRNDGYDESVVHRHNTPEVTEAEKALDRIDAVKQEIQRREADQVALARKMGGLAALDMLEDALAKAKQEQAELRERYAEAVRRIDHAESIATEEEQYRITDARTKLVRMERHQLMLDSRVDRIQADLDKAVAQAIRFDHPAINPTQTENDMILQKIAERLLNKDPATRQDLENLWGSMVLPGKTLDYKQAIKRLRRGEADRIAPSVSLMAALMEIAMEEVQP